MDKWKNFDAEASITVGVTTTKDGRIANPENLKSKIEAILVKDGYTNCSDEYKFETEELIIDSLGAYRLIVFLNDNIKYRLVMWIVNQEEI